MRILVIEDEAKVARALEQGLEGEGYAVALAHTGEEGFFRTSAEHFDLVLLDVMLPGRDGFEVLAALRQRGVRTPVLVLTARDAVADRVRGLDAGADDYLVKPFAFAELLARIRALLRRGRAEPALELALGDLELDIATHRVTRAGARIELTAREFELLEALLRHAGQVVSRETLAREVWQEERRSEQLDNVIDVYVARLRKRIDGEGRPRLIHTVRGVGFALRLEES
ncbi:MAG: response regulator transcription factor [Planctomycetes bacterium]|nr:response regulator transcription factor [Planctomycetota bacterium]